MMMVPGRTKRESGREEEEGGRQSIFEKKWVGGDEGGTNFHVRGETSERAFYPTLPYPTLTLGMCTRLNCMWYVLCLGYGRKCSRRGDGVGVSPSPAVAVAVAVT